MALQQEQQQPGHMTQEAEPSPAVPYQRNPPAGLSAREVEVLSLVACGLTPHMGYTRVTFSYSCPYTP
jgi:hypothetical protein